MTTDTKDLIAQARIRSNANCSFDDDVLFAQLADALERLTQPVGAVEPVCYHSGLGETSFDVLDADKHGWPALYSAATVARLIAERDAALGMVAELWHALSDMSKAHDALQEQVKMLRIALEKIADWDASWGAYPENNEAWRAMVVVTAREAVPRALAATEPKDAL